MMIKVKAITQFTGTIPDGVKKKQDTASIKRVIGIVEFLKYCLQIEYYNPNS